MFAFDNGADGKFLIHPKQLEAMSEIEFLGSAEIEEVKKVVLYLSQIDVDDLSIIEVEGKYYEKPHIDRILYLNRKLNKSYGS